MASAKSAVALHKLSQVLIWRTVNIQPLWCSSLVTTHQWPFSILKLFLSCTLKNQSFSLMEFGALVVILFSLFRVISKFRLRFMSCLSRSWEMQRELLQWLFQFWYSGILFQWLGSLDTASLWLGLFSTMRPRKGAGTIDTSCSAFKYRFYLFYDNLFISTLQQQILLTEIEASLRSRCYNFDSPVFLKKSGRDTQRK